VIEMQEPPVAPPTRRRRWITPIVVTVVAVAGIGVGVAIANRDDTPAPAATTSSELADISQACTTWMNDDSRWGTASAGWCQDMTSWMSQQMANGTMIGSMMWGNPDRMLTTCQTWMNSQPSSNRPNEWCETMMRGMWPHMNGDWEHWDDWMNGPMMGG
jgi:hypothetical protein